MIGAVRNSLALLARLLLSLRYRIRVMGMERLKNLRGPILILPNHPAFIDPPIVLTTLYPRFHPRPLLFEGNFQNPFMRLMTYLLDSLKVPDLDQTDVHARQRAHEAIEGVIQALRAGQNVILWPSGKLQRTGVENLGAARTLSEVISQVPEANMVLVRTTGLWGSRFGYGWNGKTPPLGKRFLEGLLLILANILFFAPRREVTLTLEKVDRSQLPGLDREKLNPWLEKWYNQGSHEPIHIPAHFWFGPRTREFPRYENSIEVDLSKLTPEIRQKVNELVATRLHNTIPDDDLQPEVTLERLGLDSIDRMELSLQVERQFGFTGGGPVPVTLGQLYQLATGLAPREAPQPPPQAWFAPVRYANAAILGETVAEAFVARALANPKDPACCDDLSGLLDYERLLTASLIMAGHFRKYPEKNVGVLLPSSVACDVTLLGLYLADKLPVILNWTTGPNNLDHAAKVMGLQNVVTSEAFIRRTGIAISGVSFLHLEQLRKKTSKPKALGILLAIRYLPFLVRRWTPQVDPDSPAVTLFTSGSEKAPKAVPLTHRNILFIQRGGTEVLQVSRRDTILGFLPAFHSFGFSITGLYPLLSGIRVVRHPDPTDAAALARKVGLYKATILVGTPTFVSYILERARPGELKSLHLVVVGAEKCSPAIFERLKKEAPQAEVLEGYGITECSPVVSVNPRGASREGTVGIALPGVKLMVVDLETEQPLTEGQMGMLLVSGPSIFPGYIGEETTSPFREIDGKRWYVTGDLVSLDREGYIHFSGRLKRFLKAGGEMISLPALEEPFVKKFPPTKDGHRVAVEGVEIAGGDRRIVLFTTENLTLREASDILLGEGYHGVMRIDAVEKVDTIPVLGTGKADYKVLRARIENQLG